MARIFNRDMSRQEIMKRVGDISQIAGARQSRLISGMAEGVHAVDVKTGSGLSFTILPDRGMDIAWAEYKGIPFGYISKTGITAPAYNESTIQGFQRGFYGGLLTTCGLTYMGAACIDEGVSLEPHGRASKIPAEDVCVSNSWDGNEFIMDICGRIRESRIFGENIVLTREIRAKMGESRFTIRDTVENCGFESQPLMLLYHCNFGYPLLDSCTKLVLPEGTVRARDKEAEKGLEIYGVFSDPVHKYSEQVFYHDLKPDEDGRVTACLYNKEIGAAGLGAYVKFEKRMLPHLIEWKQVGEGDYVVGLEPGTWYPEGRCEARKRGELKFIEPGEAKVFELEIGIIEGQAG